MTKLTQAERITALEVEVKSLKAELSSANQKLDELLALRNKGAGAFWLGTTLFGVSVMGFMSFILDWVKS